MLLRKQRITEIDKVRQKNQKWKNEIAKQMLQKQIEKRNKHQQQQQQIRIQDQKIRKYQDLINNRIKEGGLSKRGKQESKSLIKNSISMNSNIRKDGLEKRGNKLLPHNSSKKLQTHSQEQIPLFPEIQSDKQKVIKREEEIPNQNRLKTKMKQNQNENENKVEMEMIIKESPIKKKRRKSTAKKREDTIESIMLPDTANSIQIQKLEEQNKKLKQQLQKKNETLQNLLKLIRVQNEPKAQQQEHAPAESQQEIGFTQYIKMDPQIQKRSPPKKMFPSLNFKDAPIIYRFNFNAAKKANTPANTAQFIENSQEN